MRAVKEDWRQHPRFVSYEVSTLGRVRRLTASKGTYKGRLKRPSVSTTGYAIVSIEGKPRKVHVLVLETFVGPRPKGCDACHNDGSRLNSALLNLRWAPRTENMADARKHGTLAQGESHGLAKLTAADVIEIRKLAASGVLQKVLALCFAVTPGHVSEIVNRKTWAHL